MIGALSLKSLDCSGSGIANSGGHMTQTPPREAPPMEAAGLARAKADRSSAAFSATVGRPPLTPASTRAYIKSLPPTPARLDEILLSVLAPRGKRQHVTFFPQRTSTTITNYSTTHSLVRCVSLHIPTFYTSHQCRFYRRSVLCVGRLIGKKISSFLDPSIHRLL